MQTPEFNHPEVKVFYEHDLNIPSEKVEAVLALPGEPLIEDRGKKYKKCYWGK